MGLLLSPSGFRQQSGGACDQHVTSNTSCWLHGAAAAAVVWVAGDGSRVAERVVVAFSCRQHVVPHKGHQGIRVPCYGRPPFHAMLRAPHPFPWALQLLCRDLYVAYCSLSAAALQGCARQLPRLACSSPPFHNCTMQQINEWVGEAMNVVACHAPCAWLSSVDHVPPLAGCTQALARGCSGTQLASTPSNGMCLSTCPSRLSLNLGLTNRTSEVSTMSGRFKLGPLSSCCGWLAPLVPCCRYRCVLFYITHSFCMRDMRCLQSPGRSHHAIYPLAPPRPPRVPRGIRLVPMLLDDHAVHY